MMWKLEAQQKYEGIKTEANIFLFFYKVLQPE